MPGAFDGWVGPRLYSEDPDMTKIVAGLIILVLLAFIGYHRLHTEPITPRQSITDGVEQVKKNTKLSPEQESLLRIQLALADFMATSGEAPETLDRLVPKYFDEVPKNPATGQPFPYYRQGKMPKIGTPPTDRGEGLGNRKGEFDFMAPGSGFINPNVIPVDSFVYDRKGRRDPFEPIDKTNTPTIDPTRPEIEQVPLGSLRLTATIHDSKGGFKAVVETAQGRGYTVVVGSRVGMNQGIVTIIEQDTMKVLENSVDFTGKQTQSLVEMKINHATEAERSGAPKSFAQRKGRQVK